MLLFCILVTWFWILYTATSLLCNTALCLAGLILFSELFCIAPPAFCRFHFNISCCCSHFYPGIGLMRRSCQGCDETIPVYFGLVPKSTRQTRMHNQRLQVNVHFSWLKTPLIVRNWKYWQIAHFVIGGKLFISSILSPLRISHYFAMLVDLKLFKAYGPTRLSITWPTNISDMHSQLTVTLSYWVINNS